ncbi:MAG: hypothetical protein R2911_01305 [Caldilineaceae bacterium]
MAAGQAVWVRFGNSTAPLVSGADANVAPIEDIVVCDLPATDDVGNPLSAERDPWEEEEQAIKRHDLSAADKPLKLQNEFCATGNRLRKSKNQTGKRAEAELVEAAAAPVSTSSASAHSTILLIHQNRKDAITILS